MQVGFMVLRRSLGEALLAVHAALFNPFTGTALPAGLQRLYPHFSRREMTQEVGKDRARLASLRSRAFLPKTDLHTQVAIE